MHGQDFQPVHFFRLLLILREGDFHRRVKRVQQPPRSLSIVKIAKGSLGSISSVSIFLPVFFNLFYNRWVDLFLFKCSSNFFTSVRSGIRRADSVLYCNFKIDFN